MAILTTKNTTGSTGVNNGIKDPFQGFDCTLWMLDATGNLVNRGFFTSVQFTFRNATEPYMELSQRVPRYLDGDFQIGWVAQRGMLDTNVLTETMGFASVTRQARVSRSPRFNLVMYINAPELAKAEGGGKDYNDTLNLTNRYANNVVSNNGTAVPPRSAQGKIVLLNCKLDTFAMGVQSGQRVVANQWEGLSEGYQVYNTTDTKGKGALSVEEASINRVVNGRSAAFTTVGNGVSYGGDDNPDGLSYFYR